MKVIDVKISDLKFAEYNPRAATEKEMNDLKESLKRFGFVDPDIVNGAKDRFNVIIGGHMRTKAWQELGNNTAPCVYVDIPDIKREQELNIRLNKNTGHWDFDMLANFDEEILLETGFESQELDDIFGLNVNEDEFDIDKEYQKIKEPKTKLGDIYQLGDHRLMCGSATKKEDAEKLMNGKKADMVFTDLPYNVDYKGKGKNTSEGIIGDKQEEDEFISFSEMWIQIIKDSLKTGGVYYICSGFSSYPTFLYGLRVAGLYFNQPIIWVKNNTSYGWNDYRYKHEMIIKGNTRKVKKKKAETILYGWNGGKHYFMETRFEADVWEVKRKASNKMVHPTQKPLELVGRAIRNSSKREDIVLDLFGGSGSTLISAENEGRIAYLMELDPKYCDVIIARWEMFSNGKAKKL